jgi:hypothetical protein
MPMAVLVCVISTTTTQQNSTEKRVDDVKEIGEQHFDLLFPHNKRTKITAQPLFTHPLLLSWGHSETALSFS